jgi:EamA domain-containing membrane protein RarD
MGTLIEVAARPGLAAILGALAIAFSGIFYRWSGVSPATGVFLRCSPPKLPAAIPSLLLLVQPVTTVILGAILLGEQPSTVQLAGVLLVLAGLATATGAIRRLLARGMPSATTG